MNFEMYFVKPLSYTKVELFSTQFLDGARETQTRKGD